MKPPKINADTFPRLFGDPVLSHILSLIGTGSANGIHAATIGSMVNLDDRSTRKAIEKIRRCSDCKHGYYFPATSDEIEEFIKREERRAKSILFTLKSARRLRRKCYKG